MATMSGGTLYYQKDQLPRPPPPPPLSMAEARPIYEKYVQPGTAANPLVVCTDTASACSALFNGRKMWANRAVCLQVSHGKEQWAKVTHIPATRKSKRPARSVVAGTQLLDGMRKHEGFHAGTYGLPLHGRVSACLAVALDPP